jgi:hypothetical protein
MAIYHQSSGKDEHSSPDGGTAHQRYRNVRETFSNTDIAATAIPNEVLRQVVSRMSEDGQTTYIR